MKKQIQELAELICVDCAEYDDCEWGHGKCEMVLREARMLVGAGYRKTAEARKGHWNIDGTCSECGVHVLSNYMSYCPNCGADMGENSINNCLNEVYTLETTPIKAFYDEFIPDACKNCSNHPSNGGSGFCNCTLGLPTVK